MQRGMGVPSLPKFQSVMCVYINSTTHVASPSPPQCGPLVPFNSPSSSSQWQGGYHVSTYLGTYPDSGSHQSFSSKSPLPITPLIPRSPPPRRRRHSRRSSSGINLPFLSKFLDHGLSAPVSKVPSPQDKPTPQQNSTAHCIGKRRKKGRKHTANASGFTPFSIIEMQMDRVRRSRWQFCFRQSARNLTFSCSIRSVVET